MTLNGIRASAVYPLVVLAAVIAILAGVLLLWGVLRKEKQDAVPATTIGVLVHASACLLIAMAILLG